MRNASRLSYYESMSPESILDFHRRTWGDLRMEADPAPGGEPKGGQGDAPPSGDGTTPKPDDSQTGTDWKAQARKWEDRAKENSKAAEKLAELEAAKLTDQQRLEKERDDAKSAATQASTTLVRYEAAEKANLPLSWAKRLVGDTPEELEADAKAVAADLAEKAKPGTPKPDPSQGRGNDGAGASTVSSAREEYLERRRKNKR